MEIEIDITDLRVFAAVAHVIDRDDVQDRIDAIRKSWKITTPISSEEFDRWIKEFHEDITLTPEAAETFESASERLDMDSRHYILTPLQELQMNKQLSEVRLIEYEIQHALHMLRLPEFFYHILLKVVLCNKISEEDISEAKKIQNDTKRYKFDKNNMEKFEAKMWRKVRKDEHFEKNDQEKVLDKNITEEQRKKAKIKMLQKVTKSDFYEKNFKAEMTLNDTKRHFLSDWLFEGLYLSDGFESLYGGDNRTEIKRDRHWYWLKKQGMSYRKIAEQAPERGKISPSLYRENVRVQIERYEHFLCMNI